MKIEYRLDALTAEALVLLRNEAGWGNTPLAQAQKAVANTPFSVAAFDGEKVVGMGRMVGDGVLILYIQDLIVLPEYQKLGIGSGIMERLLSHAFSSGMEDTTITIGLMAAAGKEAFYERFGFHVRPNEREGAGMVIRKKINR